MQHLLGTVGMKSNMSHRDIEEKFELLLETNDIFLDRAVSSCKDRCFFIISIFSMLKYKYCVL